jgi:hypothetical protein
MIIIILYALFCLLVAYLGKLKKFGFWGNFAVALLLTPIIGLVVLLAQDDRPTAAKEEAAA